MAVMTHEPVIECRAKGVKLRKKPVITFGNTAADKKLKPLAPAIWRRRAHVVNAVGVAALILVALAIAYIMSAVAAPRRPADPPDPDYPLPPSPSKAQKFARAAVCSDGEPCSAIGRDILGANGSAVDAAVATLFCNGLVNSQSMGLGGGCMMVVYDQASSTGHAVIAREAAPLAVSEDLYKGDKGATRKGALAIAVPGELKGYWSVHQRFGRLPWADIIQPTIELCENGYPMSKHQRDSLDYREAAVRSDPLLRSIFVNSTTEEFHPMGTVIRPLAFCKTLRMIAEEGGDCLYNGSLADRLIQDIANIGGIITRRDLLNYKVRWSEPIKTKLAGDLTVLGTPPPGSGVLLAFILNVLDGFHFTPQDLMSSERTVKDIHYTVEAFKYAFAKRGELGDPEFSDIEELIQNLTSPLVAATVRERIETQKPSEDPKQYLGEVYSRDDHGTAHVSVIDAEGNAVSVTSSVNLYFGAGLASEQTGIILNSGIDDFSFPEFYNYFGLGWSPTNRLAPAKMSLSSMCPTIVLEGDKVRLVIGASGGTKITTAVALVFMRHLWLGEDLKAAVDASRFHHQLVPQNISYEYGMLKSVREGLEAMGHKLTRYRDRGSIVCALARIGEFIFGNADYRKGGEVYGI